MIHLVVPCFNEAQRLNVEYFTQIAEATSVRFVFVDDGSTDSTHSILRGFTLCIPHSSVIRLNRNCGKGAAVLAGMQSLKSRNSKDSFVGFLDADMAFSSVAVIEFVAQAAAEFQAQDLDAVWASRVKLAGKQIIRSDVRHWISRVLISILGNLYPNLPYDPQAGLKLFRASSMNSVWVKQRTATRWFLDIELLADFRSLFGKEMKLIELPVREWREIAGSKITMRQFVSVAKDVLTIAKLLRKV